MGKKVYVALVVSVVSQATLESYLGIVLMILSTKYRPIDMKRIYLNHLVVRNGAMYCMITPTLFVSQFPSLCNPKMLIFKVSSEGFSI